MLSVLELETLERWPLALSAPSPHFSALVALDASGVPDDELNRVAGLALGQGLAYLCAWGPDCERFHDAVDATAVAAEVEAWSSGESVVMTTWHPDESLEDALRFLLMAAWPDAAYEATCHTLLGISVGSAAWGETIRRAFMAAAQ